MLWSTLTLDAAGNASTAEHWRRVYQPNRIDEATYTSIREYRITGDSITVGYFKPCPPNAVCLGNQVGKLTESTLTLTYPNMLDDGVNLFLYRLAQTY